MAYYLEYDPEAANYLFYCVPLSREGRLRVFVGVDQNLREHGDHFLNDPGYRTSPGSSCFNYSFTLRDDHGDGRIHTIRFVVDATSASYGVLWVRFVEHEAGAHEPMP